jgi:hypothetical protein
MVRAAVRTLQPGPGAASVLWRPDRRRTLRWRVTLVSLRHTLDDDAANSRLIFTEPGLGYRWIGKHEA